MGSDLRIGFFGGTFDPIHLGHLNLVVELKEKCRLDQVLLCPTQLSPTKQDRPAVAENFHRLEMVKLAIEDIPWTEVTEIEIGRPPPSYTVETIDLLKKREGKGKHFFLMMAEDSAYEIGSWKKPEKLLEMAPPLVGTRHGFDPSRLEMLPPTIKSKLEEGWIQISAMDISSTLLRERLKKRLFCGHLIPAKVLDYIYVNRLYYTS
ncbi:MAG: nicotinate (nicotinamide) nucleotide adenylyltransferase [Simkania sp.]|nr:nicotinate (nicotinamide) nucleotide adenylyltransferase [Simkania sp.]